MKVCLKVSGEQLLARVAAELARKDSAFPRQLMPNLPLQWLIEPLPPILDRRCLENSGTQATIAVIEADGAQVINELCAIASHDYPALTLSRRQAEPFMPVILALKHELPTAQLLAMPAIVTDWVNGHDAMQDLARRVYAALRRRSPQIDESDRLRLSLQIEPRLLCYGSESVLLTPSEVALAELFLGHFGSTISRDDIQLLLKLSGRSTEGSNVRVTMFQLRFKIEALTHRRYTLNSTYGHGYVLRQSKAGDGIGSGGGSSHGSATPRLASQPAHSSGAAGTAGAAGAVCAAGPADA